MSSSQSLTDQSHRLPIPSRKHLALGIGVLLGYVLLYAGLSAAVTAYTTEGSLLRSAASYGYAGLLLLGGVAIGTPRAVIANRERVAAPVGVALVVSVLSGLDDLGRWQLATAVPRALSGVGYEQHAVVRAGIDLVRISDSALTLAIVVALVAAIGRGRIQRPGDYLETGSVIGALGGFIGVYNVVLDKLFAAVDPFPWMGMAPATIAQEMAFSAVQTGAEAVAGCGLVLVASWGVVWLEARFG